MDFEEYYKNVSNANKNGSAPSIQEDGTAKGPDKGPSLNFNDKLTRIIATYCIPINQTIFSCHILFKKDTRYITMAILFDVNSIDKDELHMVALLEIDRCIWEHYKDKIGGYDFKNKIYLIEKPKYICIDPDTDEILDIKYLN